MLMLYSDVKQVGARCGACNGQFGSLQRGDGSPAGDEGMESISFVAPEKRRRGVAETKPRTFHGGAVGEPRLSFLLSFLPYPYSEHNRHIHSLLHVLDILTAVTHRCS
jgi:hypothetical protein